MTLWAGAAALGFGHGVGKMDRGKRCESEWFLQGMARHLTPVQDKVWHGACWEMKLHVLGWQMAHGFICQAKCLRIYLLQGPVEPLPNYQLVHLLSKWKWAINLVFRRSQQQGRGGECGRRVPHGGLWCQIAGWLKMSWGLHEDKYISES